MDYILWVILVMIDLYNSNSYVVNMTIKYLIERIKNALPVCCTGRAPRKR
jgi:hypothetical protein